MISSASRAMHGWGTKKQPIRDHRVVHLFSVLVEGRIRQIWMSSTARFCSWSSSNVMLKQQPDVVVANVEVYVNSWLWWHKSVLREESCQAVLPSCDLAKVRIDLVQRHRQPTKLFSATTPSLTQRPQKPFKFAITISVVRRSPTIAI